MSYASSISLSFLLITQSRGIAPTSMPPFTSNMLLSHHINQSDGTSGGVSSEDGDVFILQTKVPVKSKTLPYLELLHSSLLPVASLGDGDEPDK